MDKKIACLLLSLFAVSVHAEWVSIGSKPLHELEHFIDHDSVKQSGPMAIYRQVQVLTQGDKLTNMGFQSVLGNYEYDCMNGKFRALKETGYKEHWAKGDGRTLKLGVDMVEWTPLPQSPLGQMTFDLVCPSGNDNQ